MKKIEAMIKKDKLEFLKKGLADEDLPSMTAYEVRGRGRQGSPIVISPTSKVYLDLLPKQKIEIIVNDEDVEKVIKVIIEKCRTGKQGDGKIFVSDVKDVIRIRDGARGNSAI